MTVHVRPGGLTLYQGVYYMRQSWQAEFITELCRQGVTEQHEKGYAVRFPDGSLFGPDNKNLAGSLRESVATFLNKLARYTAVESD